jgi:hypothetical protein
MKRAKKALDGSKTPMERQILLIGTAAQHWQLDVLTASSLEKDPREQYLVLSGEPLCQYLLRRDPGILVIARGPTPFLTGNKATVGYISPLTGLPHYSYVGGRVAAHLFFLGLDAIALKSAYRSLTDPPIITVTGRAPSLNLAFKEPRGLPTGQRSTFYWLVENELDGDAQAGSVLTLGDAAYLGYQSANLAAEGIYHAGRGGAGRVFARFAAAMVLRGKPLGPFDFFGEDDAPFARNPNREITPLIDQYCHRLSSRTGGTIQAAQNRRPTGGQEYAPCLERAESRLCNGRRGRRAHPQGHPRGTNRLSLVPGALPPLSLSPCRLCPGGLRSVPGRL